jgi:hypothetical protein
MESPIEKHPQNYVMSRKELAVEIFEFKREN